MKEAAHEEGQQTSNASAPSAVVASAKSRRRCQCMADYLALLLLVAECLLWLSNRLAWPAWHKGYAVLVCVAAFGMTLLVGLLCFVVALVWRWRFQFTIRSLLIMAVSAALGSGWLATELKRAREQARLIGEVRTSARRVWYDGSSQPVPAWLLGLLRDDFFADVALVDLESCVSFDAALERLPGFARLEQLSLDEDDVTDDHLAQLAGLTNLKFLSLCGTNVTDAGLAHLANLRSLNTLYLCNTAVTDAGLAQSSAPDQAGDPVP